MALRQNNIFKYATSELTQDAFICWLLSHLTTECYNIDEHIRAVAFEIMSEIFGSVGIVIDNDFRIDEIKTQYKKIDVLLSANGYKIIIEDKTFTDTHSNQINRYKNALIEEGINADKIICVFYKIIEQAEKENVDYQFDRVKLLEIFRKYSENIENPIFIDYLEYLESIESEVNSYKNSQIKDWSNRAYIGFFEHLRKEVLNGDGCWSYVANFDGGFMCLWINNILSHSDLDRIGFEKELIKDLYLQFEPKLNKSAISVKYSVENTKEISEDKKEIVLEYKRKIVSYFKECIGEEFIKSRNSFNETMTVGYIYYDENNYIDKLELMKKTLANLKSVR